MKKLLFLFLLTSGTLFAGNVITYTATAQLAEKDSQFSPGLFTTAFNVSITGHTFANGTGTITFAGDVTTIGDDAFSYCQGLTSIDIPSTVTSLGIEAFANCSALTSITLPASLKSIANFAFYECYALPSVIIPDSVTSVGPSAFAYCRALSAVTLPEGITSINNYTFIDCSALTSITIPASVTSIGQSAFDNCSALTSITIPASVTSIGQSAFDDCSALTSITCLALVPPTLGRFCFRSVPADIPVYLPCGTGDAYAASWSYFTHLLASYQLNISVNDLTLGSISAASGAYCRDEVVTVSATPETECRFVRWSDGSTDNPRVISLTSDTTIVAEFARNQYALVINTNDETRGLVTGAGKYFYADTAIVEAIPYDGFCFTGWSDGSNDNPRKVVVTGVIVLSAQFDIRQCHLTLSLLNDACGELSGEGIYDYGTLVTCVATPKSGYRFVCWSDGVTENPYRFEIFDDLALTAQFDEIPKEEEPGDDQAIHPATADVSATLVLDRGILCIRRGNHTSTLPGHLLK